MVFLLACRLYRDKMHDWTHENWWELQMLAEMSWMKPERQCTFIDGTVRDKDIPRGATHTNCSKRTDERKLFNQAIMSLQVSPVKRQVASVQQVLQFYPCSGIVPHTTRFLDDCALSGSINTTRWMSRRVGKPSCFQPKKSMCIRVLQHSVVLFRISASHEIFYWQIKNMTLSWESSSQ